MFSPYTLYSSNQITRSFNIAFCVLLIVQTFQGNRSESDNSIFAWRVTWNYAYSPFNQTDQLPNKASEFSSKLLFITNLKWWFTSFEYSKLIPSFLNENVNILFYFYFLIHSFKQCKEISNLNRLNTHVFQIRNVFFWQL